MIDRLRLPNPRDIAVAALSAGGLLLTACAEEPATEQVSIVYNDDGTVTERYNLLDTDTFFMTTLTACDPERATTHGVTQTTTYADGTTKVDAWTSDDLCDGGAIVANEMGIPRTP
jgi:hypothetical protein